MRKRVLVVDDDPATRQVLGAFLRDFGVDVHDAATDDEGYQRYLELGPDLMFIDVLLPRQGGLSLLRRVRAVRGGKAVPVLVMSALYRGGDIRKQSMDELGALDVLKKPFQFDLLRERLRGVLADAPEEAPEAVTPFAPTEVLSRGTLSSVDVPVLLKDLAFHKTTACLNLRSERLMKVLFFQDGEIVFAVSNQMRETLGRHLLGRGQIDEDAYRRGLEAMRVEGKKMGEFLVQEELLAAGAVYDAVRQNVVDKILDVFTWGQGDFRLSPFKDPPAALPGQPLDVNRVLWDGVRSVFPFERVSTSLNPFLELNLLPQGDLFELATEVPLEKEDLQFLRMLRRLKGRPLGSVLKEVQGEREVRFLYYLLLRGYLTLSRGLWDGTDGREFDPTDLERIRRARRQLEALRARNYFQVLEVPLNASDEKVREAYFQRAKDVHPDMLGPADPPELKHLHGETFHVIQAAYDALKTEPRRKEYLRFIQEGIEETVADGSKILEAESLFQEGRMQLKRRNWDGAAQAFQKALELNPDEGEYLLDLGVAKMRQAAAGRPDAAQEAGELFERARTLLTSSPEPLYRLGRLALLRGNAEEAATWFQRALARSPNHMEALRELRLIKMREDKKGGVLSALLGKRDKP